MVKPIALVFGLALTLCLFWKCKDCPAKTRRVTTTIGLALLCWLGIVAWLDSAAQDPMHNHAVWEAMLHLKRIVSGVIIGLILGLLVQGELFCSKKKLDEVADGKTDDTEDNH
jgi:predicted membrane protein